MNKFEVLSEYFGYTGFRSGQAEIIDSIMSRKDVLGIMPTGAGKSICYQVPSLMFRGLSVVVSPLISLMKDQVGALLQSGVSAAYINSSLTPRQYFQTIENARLGAYRIIYVAPERLMSDDFISFAQSADISMLTVDEAHCVSQWGQDFRPSYLKITEFVNKLLKRPVIAAFTATATKEVQQDIVKHLELNNPYKICTGFDRSNLYFEVKRPDNKNQALLSILALNKDKSGIVYCTTRKTVETLCEMLLKKGYSATRYHAGLSDEERRQNQDAFLYDKSTVMVATNAFGMGIDKPNVSFVVHYNMPKNLESYYQEAGRAGRDGMPAECILLYNGKDVHLNKFLIENGEYKDMDEQTRQKLIDKDLELLRTMTFYATGTGCLRSFMLGYFGDKAPASCDNCSNCNTNFETVDITTDAQKIVSCVYRVQKFGSAYGKGMIAEILRGSTSEKVVSSGMTDLSTYGIMAESSVKYVHFITDYLAENDYLSYTADKYPVLVLGSRYKEVVVHKKQITLKMPKEQKMHKTVATEQNELFGALRSLRKLIAEKEKVPSFFIFTDATLRDMCEKLPQDRKAFLGISGVGQAKLEKYGDEFIKSITRYVNKSVPEPVQPKNADWVEQEDVKLKLHYKYGSSISDIAEDLGRSKTSVRARLIKLGYYDD